MSKERELLRKAASFLHDTYDGVSYMESLLQEIDEVLEEPEVEPVACTNSDSWNCKYCNKSKDCPALNDSKNFYPPRQPVQLSKSEIFEIWDKHIGGLFGFAYDLIAAYEEKQK